jgi:hypothetical protein
MLPGEEYDAWPFVNRTTWQISQICTNTVSSMSSATASLLFYPFSRPNRSVTSNKTRQIFVCTMFFSKFVNNCMSSDLSTDSVLNLTQWQTSAGRILRAHENCIRIWYHSVKTTVWIAFVYFNYSLTRWLPWPWPACCWPGGRPAWGQCRARTGPDSISWREVSPTLWVPCTPRYIRWDWLS